VERSVVGDQAVADAGFGDEVARLHRIDFEFVARRRSMCSARARASAEALYAER